MNTEPEDLSEPFQEPDEFQNLVETSPIGENSSAIKYRNSYLPYKLTQTIPERFRDWRLEDLEPIPEAIRKYVDDLRSIRRGDGLIIIGPTGTGKTTLAIAVLHAIAERASEANLAVSWERFARFITAHDLCDIARDFESLAFLEHKKIKLLVIDDIGASRLTDFGQTELASLFDSRYASMLPTIITSNLSAADFKTYMGERSLSRFVECCTLVELTGPDRRMSPAQENNP